VVGKEEVENVQHGCSTTFQVNNFGSPWSIAKLGKVVATRTIRQWSPSWNIYKTWKNEKGFLIPCDRICYENSDNYNYWFLLCFTKINVFAMG
jgi:hypothetical protein